MGYSFHKFIVYLVQFLTVCLKRVKLSVFLINSGKLFHRVGPTNEKAFCPMFLLRKGNFKFCRFISCIYSTIWSKFKNFFQVIRASVIDKFECNSVYTLINSLVGNHFINLKSSSDI